MNQPGRMNLLMTAAAMLMLVSCSSTGSSYIEDIQEFNLTSATYLGMPTGLTRAQTAHILYGTLTAKEKRDRLGQYYTIQWEDNTPDTPLDLVFEYQRAGSSSKIYRHETHYPAGRQGGEVDVHINFSGEDYLRLGRVMAWKATLLLNGREISRRTSYLWEDPK